MRALIICVANSKSRRVELPRCRDNIIIHRDMPSKSALMKTGSSLKWVSWPHSLADTVIAGLNCFSEKQAAPSAIYVLSWLWWRELLKVLKKQPEKRWQWLNHRSYFWAHPAYHNHACSYDFVHCRTDGVKIFRRLNIVGDLFDYKNPTDHRSYSGLQIMWSA